MLVRMRRALALFVLVSACNDTPPAMRPPPTPGPIAAVTAVTSISGGARVQRGEIVRFAVVGTGTGTHFGSSTFLQMAGFEELAVVAVESTAKLWAQGRVSLGSPAGKKDLAAVSGSEIAVAQWALEVIEPEVVKLGVPPADSALSASGDAGVLDPLGDVDLYEIEALDGNLRTLVVRVDTPPGSPLVIALELYSPGGAKLAAPRYACAAVQTRGTRVLARVADIGRRGGEDFRYRLVASYEQPEACLTWEPGNLPPL